MRISHMQMGWIIARVEKVHLSATNRAAVSRPNRRREKMKTMILALAAVLGIAAGTAALSPSAQASQTQLYAPAQNGNG